MEHPNLYNNADLIEERADNYLAQQDVYQPVHDFIATNDVILMGMTGVGKTTFISHLQRVTPVRYISLGEITRSAMSHQKDETIRLLMEKGGVWPLEVIQNSIAPYITQPSPYVLDGVPKHVEEAQWLASHMATRPYESSAVILTASEEIVRRRIAEDNERVARPETIEQVEDRIRVFNMRHGAVMNLLHYVLSRTIVLDTSDMSPVDTLNKLNEVV